MTVVAIDGSALVHRYVPGPRRDEMARILAGHRYWVVSALARTEVTGAVLHLLDRLGSPPGVDEAIALGRLAVDWDGFWQIPVDEDCLHRASRLVADHGLGLVPAVQLAGFSRLARSCTILTADPSLALVAESLEFPAIELVGSVRPASGLLVRP